MIFARIRIEPKFQVLRVKNHGQLEVMNDDVSIGFYNVKDESFIYLESIQDKKDESQVLNRGACTRRAPDVSVDLPVGKTLLCAK